jgi:bacillopeptidase F
MHAIGSIKSNQIQSKQRQQRYWGVENVKASDVWAQGITGQGVRVMIIDTGLNVGHKDLRDNYVGDEYGWLDAVNNRRSAYDDHGHGSHCAGSVLGKNGMGVAPDAQMMGCKALSSSGSGGSDAFDKCAEYTLSPKGDTNRRAHVVSNSWGGGQGTYFDKHIKAWREAGIIPVFAAGNDGRCNTIGYPGTHKDVITVGATAEDNSLAGFSSRGPGPNHESEKNKPEVSAPGEDINSASHRGDGNAEMSGTSMACPHVAGLVALMMQDNLELEYNKIKDALQSSARTDVKSAGEQCGGRRFFWEPESPRRRDNEFPNWHFGYGIISAPGAMAKL